MKTVKEIAEELGVSRQSVHNEMSRQGIRKLSSKPGAAALLDDNEAALIIKAFQDRRNKAVKQVTVKSQSTIDTLIDILKTDIDAKNRQIEALQEENKAFLEQLEKANQTIEDLQKTIQQAQFLHAETIQQITQKAENPEGQKVVDPAPAPDPDGQAKAGGILHRIVRLFKGE